MRVLLVFLILSLTSLSHAGVMELSANYGVRESTIDENNYTKNTSAGGSFAWYFLEMSAIELSYTKGRSIQSLKATTDPDPIKYIADFEMFGADLVLTLATKSSFIQPFVRGGMARLKKEIYKEEADGTVTKYGEPVDDVVPSYGAGLKINLTQTFAIKLSYDRWRSGSNGDKETWDEAIKAGVSWYF
jgi:hypothetical protein